MKEKELNEEIQDYIADLMNDINSTHPLDHLRYISDNVKNYWTIDPIDLMEIIVKLEESYE